MHRAEPASRLSGSSVVNGDDAQGRLEAFEDDSQVPDLDPSARPTSSDDALSRKRQAHLSLLPWIADIDMSEIALVEYAEEVNPSSVIEIQGVEPNGRIGSTDPFRYRLISQDGRKGPWTDSVFVPDEIDG